MHVDPGVAAIITAFATAAVMFGGYVLARKGQREQVQQQAAASSLAALEKRSDRAEAAEVRERERAERAEAELDEQRSLARKQLSDVAARCRAAQAELTDALITLRSVVVNEVARSAAKSAVDTATEHPHDEETP